jgi:tRNA 2-(methylsulfanyl)-N6-isopentenyladenosine37 hydroxylase
MLGLKLATDPRWVDIASKSIEEILTDHAWCEQKAATSGITLIVKYSEKERLVKELTSLVSEEWGHFKKVLKELEKRGLKLGPQRVDHYVVKLKQMEIGGGSREQSLVEKLLNFAMIEARSCERFRLLSLHIQEESLKLFYHEFMVSEAGHYRMFLDLANEYMPSDYVKSRWNEILTSEAEILSQLKVKQGRIH